jgi:hypothetical protein
LLFVVETVTVPLAMEIDLIGNSTLSRTTVSHRITREGRRNGTMNQRSHTRVVSFLESFSSHFALNVIEVTTVTLTSTEFIHESSARVNIVSRISLPPFSGGIIVRRAVTKIAGDIRICEAQVLHP